MSQPTTSLRTLQSARAKRQARQENEVLKGEPQTLPRRARPPYERDTNNVASRRRPSERGLAARAVHHVKGQV